MYDFDNMKDEEINTLFHHLRAKNNIIFAEVPDYCNDFNLVYDFMDEYGVMIDVEGTARISKSHSTTVKTYKYQCEFNVKRAFLVCMIMMMLDEDSM